MKTAADNKIVHLYHYQAFDVETDTDSDRLSDILKTNRIYLSNPKGFNDPWDCRPCFDTTQLDDPAFYERQVNFFEQCDRKRNNLSELEYQERSSKLRSNKNFLADLIHQMLGIENDIHKRYRVYCLTTDPYNVLMWSHYAKNHSGISLEFLFNQDMLVRTLQVAYFDTYPILDLADNNRETALLPLTAKSKEWNYEKEYRIIAEEEAHALSKETLITKENYLTLPEDALSAIIMGCVASEKTRSRIRDIVAQHSSKKPIFLKEAIRVPNQYRLSIRTMP